jgi:hypothetical protein
MTTLPLKVYIDRFILSQKKPKAIVNDVSDINFIYYISHEWGHSLVRGVFCNEATRSTHSRSKYMGFCLCP